MTRVLTTSELLDVCLILETNSATAIEDAIESAGLKVDSIDVDDVVAQLNLELGIVFRDGEWRRRQ